ncbi:MAG: tetratricopeptide repeat protein [Candidatus Solibacter sp.]
MRVRAALLTLLLAAYVGAQERVPDQAAPTLPQLVKEGDALYLKGDYEGALKSFTGAWNLAQQTPKEDPSRYDVLKRLTSVRAAAGEFADADTWLQQAITWRENTLGWKDPKIADDLLISVGLCRGMKDFERALVILRRIQGIHVEAFTFTSSAVADDFSRIANTYAEQKKVENAINSTNTAIDIRTKLGGALDPALLGDLDRLGEYHTLMRTYESAEAAYRHALVIRETLYGKLHPDLIASVDGLAYALFGQQKYDQAEPAYQRLLELWEASVGKDHAMVAVALDKVAAFYSAQKKYPEVRALLERSTAIRARFLAMGISQQATQAFTEEQLEQVKTFYRRGIVVLDPPSPVHDDLREQFEGMLKTMDAPLPKSAPVRRLSVPPVKKKTDKL